MAIRFAESEARAMGRTARGVIGIDLREGDAVAGVAIDEDRHNWVLTVTENGYGKRSDLDEYRLQSRNGKGLIDIKTGDRNGEAVAIEAVTYGDHLLAMSDNGQIMRTRVEDLDSGPQHEGRHRDEPGSGRHGRLRRHRLRERPRRRDGRRRGRITAGSPIAITSGIGCQRTIHGRLFAAEMR